MLAPLEAAFKRVEPGSLSPLGEGPRLVGAKPKRRKEKVREGPGASPNRRPKDTAKRKAKPSAVAPAPERADPLGQLLRQERARKAPG